MLWHRLPCSELVLAAPDSQRLSEGLRLPNSLFMKKGWGREKCIYRMPALCQKPWVCISSHQHSICCQWILWPHFSDKEIKAQKIQAICLKLQLITKRYVHFCQIHRWHALFLEAYFSWNPSFSSVHLLQASPQDDLSWPHTFRLTICLKILKHAGCSSEKRFLSLPQPKRMPSQG